MKPLKTITALLSGAVAAIIIGVGCATDASACTRVVYRGQDSLFIVARSLDWKTPIPTSVYVYPRGMKKIGADKPGSISWTSKYGAVYAVSYDAGVTEGMNEKGLVVNGLFCKGTTYTNSTNDNRSPISLAMFPAWIIDLCSTTEEARDLLKNQDFSLYGASFDGGTSSTLHWEITDATGASLIVEFQNGEIFLYDVDINKYPCMTNDPTWPKMMAIVDYWEAKGGQNMLPGTVSSPDRCVRGNYFANHVAATADADLGASIALTVLNNCCVPYDYTTATTGEPNVSMTQWHSLSNPRDLRYYFNPAVSRGLWYVDLKKCDLRKGASVLKIDPMDLLDGVGNQTHALKKVPPFKPIF